LHGLSLQKIFSEKTPGQSGRKIISPSFSSCSALTATAHTSTDNCVNNILYTLYYRDFKTGPSKALAEYSPPALSQKVYNFTSLQLTTSADSGRAEFPMETRSSFGSSMVDYAPGRAADFSPPVLRIRSAAASRRRMTKSCP
jgi:hypothetical protein